jgi:thiol-disulfide isomerase/thioredoxin
MSSYDFPTYHSTPCKHEHPAFQSLKSFLENHLRF